MDPITCHNRGSMNIKRAWKAGYLVKLGRQKCQVCGAVIEITEITDGWAFTPPHDRPEEKEIM